MKAESLVLVGALNTTTKLPGNGRSVGGIVASFLVLVLLTVPTEAQAQFNYTINGDNNSITITGYYGPPGPIDIPATIADLAVTGIGYEAFTLSGVTSVTIPDSVTSVLISAFYECSSLASVTIPSSVTDIGDYAFQYCGLTSVTIPGSATSIGDYAFGNCTSLTNVYFTGNAPTIDLTVFIDDTLATVYYDAETAGWAATFGGLQAVAVWPFTFATNNGTITVTGYTGSGGAVSIPNTVNDLPVSGIGSNAFSSCTSITSVTIANSVASIGEVAFDFCTSLTNVTIPNSVTNIGFGAFAYCINLGSVMVPGSVASIGNNAFDNCTSLTSATVANGVTSIGSYAFYECINLSSITIPLSVTNIGDYVFDDCTSLTSVYFAGNAPSADSVTFLDDSATVYYLPGTTGWSEFTANTGLTSVLWNPPPPVIQTGDGSFGVRNNQFGFTITGAANIPIVVEACTNLANPVWTPLQTLTLTDGSCYFSDPQWANFPSRFYGVGLP